MPDWDSRYTSYCYWDSHLSSPDVSSWYLDLTGEGEEVYLLSQSDIRLILDPTL
jgi:hypothetical protein